MKRLLDDECETSHKRICESIMKCNMTSDHEKRHLMSVNSEMAEFVRRSVEEIQMRSIEIQRLNRIIHDLRSTLAESESRRNIWK